MEQLPLQMRRIDMGGARWPRSMEGVTIHGAQVRSAWDGYHPVVLWSDHGDISARYYPAAGARRGVVMIGGSAGGWDSPGLGLYGHLCQELQREGVAALRVRLQRPGILDQSVHDLLGGVCFLAGQGMGSVALLGHGFGGAVAIEAACRASVVRSVVTLATQSAGTAGAALLGPRCSLLLVHGGADPVQSVFSSEYVYDMAREPKHLVIYEDAGHKLTEVTGPLLRLLRGWLTR